MAIPTNDKKFNVKNGLAVGESGFQVIDNQGNWVGASGAGQSPYGATGARGYTGATGVTGVDGATGITGEDGVQGPIGDQGNDGYSGPVGDDGQQGITGEDGVQGYDGPQGEDGVQGYAGQQGAEGPQGPQGEDGLQGATGGNGGFIGGGNLAFDPSYTGDALGLYNDSLSVDQGGPGKYIVLGTESIGNSDKVVFSFSYDSDQGGDYWNGVGVATRYSNLNTLLGGVDDQSVGLDQQGYYWFNGSNYTTYFPEGEPAWVEGDIIDVAVNMITKLFWVRVNGGNWNNNGNANPTTGLYGLEIDQNVIDNGPVYPALQVGSDDGPQAYTLQTSASYSLPSGFTFLGSGGGYAANTGAQGEIGTTGETGATGPGGARYHTTSTTLLNVTTGPTRIVVADDNLHYSADQTIIITNGSDKTIYATVVAYVPETKTLSIAPIDYIGSGSDSSWEINLNGIPGPDGATGSVGLDGATGYQGATGPQGFGGSQGETGADGEQGLTGLDGATGIPGATGSIGETGIDGEQGLTGDDGAKGEQGLIGDDGATGEMGDMGAQGADGATGVTGATGPQGDDGSTSGNGVYGNTIPQIEYSAPANSLSLGFVASDSYQNDYNNLQFDGWNGVSTIQNSGAQYWEYVGLSTKSNDTLVNNDTATIQYWDYNDNQYWIAMIETLKGTTSVPYNDDYWTSQKEYDNTAYQTINIPANGIAVLMAGVEAPGTSISSIDSTNDITWIKRSSIVAPSTHSDSQAAEVWYAINNTSSNIVTDVTVNYTDSFDDQSMIISTWMNVNLSDPWDGSGSGPTNTGEQGVTGATGSQGPEGNQGYTGDDGATGRDGASGIDGATGVTGEQGQTGPDGATGPTGVDGATGVQGNVGIDAATGITGINGQTGPDGATGPSGSTGLTGETGDYGATGWYGYRFRATISGGGYTIGGNVGDSGDIYLQVDPDTHDYSYGFAAGQTIIIYKDSDNYATALVNSYDSETGDLYVTIQTEVGSSDSEDILYTNLDGAVGIAGATGYQGVDGATGPTGATGAQGGNGSEITSINAVVTSQLDGAFLEYPFLMGSYIRIQGPVNGITAGMTVNYGGVVYTVYDYTESNNQYSFLEFTNYPVTTGAIPEGANIVIEGYGVATNTGIAGQDGATGVTGATGVQGASGVDGDQGAEGDPGSTGQDGATGVTGATGAKGITGDEGVAGATGYSLATGSTGISNTAQTAVDIFATNKVGTAKYLIQGVNGSDVQATEIILMQNSDGVYLTEYATLITNEKVMDVTATSNGTAISLKVTPVSANTNISWVRESVRSRVGGTTVEDDGSNVYSSYTKTDNAMIPLGRSYVYPNSYWYNLIDFTSLVGTEITFDTAGVGSQDPAVATVVSWDGTTLVVDIISGNFTNRSNFDKITYGY